MVVAFLGFRCSFARQNSLIKDLENMKKTLIWKKTSICPDTQSIQFLKYFVTVFYTSISMFIFNAFAFNRIYESRGKIALRERKFLC